MSPLYEDEASLAIERRIADRAASLDDCIFEKFPPWPHSRENQIEGQFLKEHTGKLVKLVEVKDRKHRIGEYETLIIDAGKLEMGLVWSSLCREPFHVIIQWENCCGSVEVTKERYREWRTAKGGRVDRGDAHDIDDVKHIPCRLFKILWKGWVYA